MLLPTANAAGCLNAHAPGRRGGRQPGRSLRLWISPLLVALAALLVLLVAAPQARADFEVADVWDAPSAPYDVALGPDGNYYVADVGSDQIRVLDPDGAELRHWGSQGSGDGQFANPMGIAFGPDGNVYVADSNNSRIQVFTPEGEFIRKWGPVGWPIGIDVSADGEVFVVEYSYRRVSVFTPEGELLRQWGKYGCCDDGGFVYPRGLGLGPDGTVWVADEGTSQAQAYSPDGTYVGKVGAHGSDDGQLLSPHGIAVGPDGAIYVGDSEFNRILVYDPDNTYLAVIGSYVAGTFGQPRGIEVDAAGRVYVADEIKESVQVLAQDLDTQITAGPEGPTNAAAPTFEFSPTDGAASFECSLVAGGEEHEFGECSGPGSAHTADEPLADGDYSFAVRAVRADGERDFSPATRQFSVDTVAPQVEITDGPEGPTNETTPTFEFSADDPDAILECSLVGDGEEADWGSAPARATATPRLSRWSTVSMSSVSAPPTPPQTAARPIAASASTPPRRPPRSRPAPRAQRPTTRPHSPLRPTTRQRSSSAVWTTATGRTARRRRAMRSCPTAPIPSASAASTSSATLRRGRRPASLSSTPPLPW